MKNLGLLLSLKVRMTLNGFHRMRRKSRVEFATLFLFFGAIAAGLFAFFFFSFRFFRSQEPFGPILVDETFYLFNFAVMIMLFISSAVASYASLYRSGEVPFLLTRPVEWGEIFFSKLTEAVWYSSWAMLLAAVPFMTAYGMTKQASPWFPLVCLLFYAPFILLTGTLGTLAATLCLGLLPSRGKRKAALVIAVVLAGIFLARIQPEVIREQGSISSILSGSLPHVAEAKNPLLPSSWISRGMIALSRFEGTRTYLLEEGLFYFLLLLSNMLFFLIPAYSAATRIYPRLYLSLQDHASIQKGRQALRMGFAEKLVDRLRWPPKPVLAFLEKDLKTFMRDPSEWSQMLIFFGLLLIYFANLKNLEFHVLKDFWKNLIFVLNTVGTYIVLSSFSMRFIFPMISMEGSRFWIIDLSPIRPSQLLLEKFLLGTALSAVFTIPLIFISGWMLEVPIDRVLYTTGLGFFVCVALTGLSVGLGALFPNFKSTNPSEIISGFGGSLLLLTHLTYLAAVGAFLFFSEQAYWLIFWTVSAASLLIGAFPLKFGMKALEQTEF